MTEDQWNKLLDVVNGRKTDRPVGGFIIDSPWIPGWYGISSIQYYGSGLSWFDANLKAVNDFRDVIMLPGFWSEFGMCTEPSAFGSKLTWYEASLPHAEKIITDISGVSSIKVPDPASEGLLPFIIQRLDEYHDRIREAGHEIKFAIARGPLNIASFLMGTTEFMMALMTAPDQCHTLLKTITQFTTRWLRLQKETFPSIDGILILDDIVGFVDDAACREFAVPYLKEIFGSFEASIRFFHNDASGLVSTPYLKEIGINMFNFSFEHSMQEIRDLAGDSITLVGNLPPRDVMAAGSPGDVRTGVMEMWESIDDKSRILWSVGGGMPQGVSSENIRAFVETLEEM
jgi:uroporphyrinogen-III decarboxylase